MKLVTLGIGKDALAIKRPSTYINHQKYEVSIDFGLIDGSYGLLSRLIRFPFSVINSEHRYLGLFTEKT